MTEIAAVYRANMTEADARIRALGAELDRWKLRVRELEDAILMHRATAAASQVRNDRLYEQMGDLWT